LRFLVTPSPVALSLAFPFSANLVEGRLRLIDYFANKAFFRFEVSFRVLWENLSTRIASPIEAHANNVVASASGAIWAIGLRHFIESP